MAMKRSKFLIILMTSLAVFFIVFLYYQQSRLFEGFEAKTYDFRFHTLRGPIPASSDIVIVAIDEKSVDELGRFPWSRTYFAQFVDKVTAAGVRGVMLDAFFPETESEVADAAFARALRESGKVSLAVAFEFAADGSVSQVTRSLPQLQQVSQYEAHINLTPDEDGVVRWTPLHLQDEQGGDVYSLAVDGARVLLGEEQVEPGVYDISIGSRTIPTDGGHFALINYAGPPGIYKRIPFVDVVKDRVDPEELRDKLVLVGSTALGIYDMRVTPFSNNSPGVEVHANMIDSILRNDFIQRGGFESLLDLIAIIALGILAAFITLSLRHSISFPLVLLLLLGHGVFAYSMFVKGHWVSMVYPEMSILLAYCLTAYLRFFFLDRKSREIRDIFSSYVSEKLVDRLVQDPSRARVGGETRVITVLFSDIANYTSYSEKLPAEEVVRNLNRYLAAMTDVIMEHDGTLDKFMGDGIMAFWGAPMPQEDHAHRAIDCALGMMQALEEVNRAMEAEGGESLSMRIGIHTGEAVVGNIGSESKKMEYTAIGDTVNVASRIEQANKLYGTTVMVSESTRRHVDGAYVLREIDNVRMKGKSEPMLIHEVLPQATELLPEFEKAVDLYRDRDFEAALQIFVELGERFADPVSARYVSSCRDYIENPPADDWDGAHYSLRR